jgi:hypothetical protein
MVLQKYNSTITAWDPDIGSTYLSEISINTTQAQYNSTLFEYGKYRIQFSIENIHGTSSTYQRIFYIDAPEFIIDR